MLQDDRAFSSGYSNHQSKAVSQSLETPYVFFLTKRRISSVQLTKLRFFGENLRMTFRYSLDTLTSIFSLKRERWLISRLVNCEGSFVTVMAHVTLRYCEAQTNVGLV